MRRSVTLVVWVVLLAANLWAQDKKQSPAHKLQIAEFAISNLYVEQVDEGKLVETAINAMLKELDPHSSYFTAAEWTKMNEPLQGNFEGIGVQFNMVEDTLMVIQPVADGPSEKVGILSGDRIVWVNDTAIAGVGMSSTEIQRRLKGPKGSEVRVGVVRRGFDEVLTFTIKRDKIPVYSIDAVYMATPTIGYIRVNNFGATTAEEFQKGLKKLKKQGMTDLILDLQGNGGGFLNAAVDLANEFLEQKELIVYTEGLRSPRRPFHAKGTGNFRTGRVIVLVDSYSASAAEIVTGAIQDWDRGLVVGRRTFGKGLVQRVVDLPDGSVMRLTVSRYYTPSGRCIQKPYESTEEYHNDLINRYNSGEMISADSIHFPDSLQCKTLRLERVVYGGGGIMPDYYIPVDTARYSQYHLRLSAKGVMLQTSLHFIDAQRHELKKQYKRFDDYNASFVVPQSLLDNLIAAGTAAGIEYNEEQFNHSRADICLQLKALIARDMWEMSEYYCVINQQNESYRKALELFEQGDFDDLMRKQKLK